MNFCISLRRSIIAFLTFTTLTGCGGGGSGGSSASKQQATDDASDGSEVDAPDDSGSPDPGPLNSATATETAFYFNELLPDFAAVQTAATAGGIADISTLPTGSVTYDGHMLLLMGNTTVSANVIGDTSLEVNIASNAITGQATDFLGVATDHAGFNHVAHYDGLVAISNGDISIVDDTLAFDIDGSLDNGLNTFSVEGTLVGGLYDDGEGLNAIGSHTGVHGNVTAKIDGINTPQTIATATVSAVKK